MVDFKKRLASSKVGPAVDPLKLYDSLDRAHDKGPLRPSQEAVLREWFEHRRQDHNVIIKLHTGQGKTLVGLLLLQSRLNEGTGPALFLCSDTFLVDQTCEQAKQFGIKVCKAETADPLQPGARRAAAIPDEFLHGRSILVTSVQKLFNGMTKFGLDNEATPVGNIVIDDAHACADIVRETFRIVVDRGDSHGAYDKLLALFSADLEHQGGGTYEEIKDHSATVMLPVPYWAWGQKISDVRAILAAARDVDGVKFAWPLVKDALEHCQCNVSGTQFEIEPYAPPISAFQSYTNAKQRVFMSATVTDDSFLVKGFRLDEKAILRPVAYDKERWSGEKMVLVPSLIDARASRAVIVEHLGRPDTNRKYGVVTLVPSQSRTSDWAEYGAAVAMKHEIRGAVAKLHSSQFEKTVALVNRYDGVDLPDDACRLLVLDGRPHADNYADRYEESCRPEADSTLMRLARRIEQGMGRSVRGEKDYSVIVLIGDDLVRALNNERAMRHISPQLRTQLSIGREIASMAQQDCAATEEALGVIKELVKQCTGRDAGWKQFYVERMAEVTPAPSNPDALRRFAAEYRAEEAIAFGDCTKAVCEIQELLDSGTFSDADRGWYLQTMARLKYGHQRVDSEKLQLSAQRSNRRLLRPQSGVTVSRLEPLDQGRMERIIEWIAAHDTYQSLNVSVTDAIERLTFGTTADRFEDALEQLGRMLGFASERPDADYKEGPDNLWALPGRKYILWECKNEVDTARNEVNKRESDQMNRSCAWFAKHYEGLECTNVLVHPAFKLESAAGLRHPVCACRERDLKALVTKVRLFFGEFQALNLKDLSAAHVQKLVDAHRLMPGSVVEESWKPVR